VHADDLDRYTSEFMSAFDARRQFRTEVRVSDKDGETRWLRAEGVPRLDDAGTFLGYTGVALDITDARIAQEHQGLLINELNHRVKNTLATVQSVVGQTLRRATTPSQARHDIDARLVALSRAHDVLTRENWEGASIAEIAFRAVEPFEARGRFHLSGPELRLNPRLSLAIAMTLHELATNALKYGALSNETGEVRVSWLRREEMGKSARLRLVWTEHGGPPVVAPLTRGFGTMLIERSFAFEVEGAARLIFEPGGLVCEIDAPIDGSLSDTPLLAS
jgi:two-component sensor histidine kinase